MTIGLVVNPIAGIGGPAGLKGSDGEDVQSEALARGSAPRATERAEAALAVVAREFPGAAIVTAAGRLGEDAVLAAGMRPVIAYSATSDATSGADTTAATSAIVAAGASLVLFVGGDGTARDVARGLGAGAAALGVPAGVKMYSECFAVSPAVAGTIAAEWLRDGDIPVRECDVLDIDEARLRAGRPDPRLYGTMPVPARSGRTQARKAATPASEAAAVRGAAAGLVAALQPGMLYLLGPGSTLAEVGRQLGLDTSLLGVDVVQDGRLIVRDASESQALEAIAGRPAKAVVTVIGGQGFLLGRGNQQLSAGILRTLGPDPLLVVATEQKLIDLQGRPLLVDTGDLDLDRLLGGHVKVTTGPASSSIYPVSAADDVAACSIRTTEQNNEGAHQCV